MPKKKLSPKKKPSSKKKNHENDKCSTCKHEKIYHYGINGICYHPNCKCYKFRQNEIIL